MKMPTIMPTIVSIFIFISREKFIFIWVEHEKSLIMSGTDLTFKTNSWEVIKIPISIYKGYSI